MCKLKLYPRVYYLALVVKKFLEMKKVLETNALTGHESPTSELSFRNEKNVLEMKTIALTEFPTTELRSSS